MDGAIEGARTLMNVHRLRGNFGEATEAALRATQLLKYPSAFDPDSVADFFRDYAELAQRAHDTAAERRYRVETAHWYIAVGAQAQADAQITRLRNIPE